MQGTAYKNIQDIKKRGEERSDKKARLRGFVVCMNGTDAGVVLFI